MAKNASICPTLDASRSTTLGMGNENGCAGHFGSSSSGTLPAENCRHITELSLMFTRMPGLLDLETQHRPLGIALLVVRNHTHRELMFSGAK